LILFLVFLLGALSLLDRYLEMHSACSHPHSSKDFMNIFGAKPLCDEYGKYMYMIVDEV